MEYALTWKLKDTPSGRTFSVLRASAPRTPAIAFTGWPTPIQNDQIHSTHAYGPKPSDGSERKRYLKLPGAVQLYGWPTPVESDKKWRYSNQEMAQRRAASGKQQSLECVAHLSGWATPTARDHKDGTSVGTVETNGLLGRQVWAYKAPTEKCGALNPAFSLWLMGYPSAWVLSGAQAMRSFRSSQPSSSNRRKKAVGSDLI